MTETADARRYAEALLTALQESWQANLQQLEQKLADGTALRTAVRAARADQEQVHARLTDALPDMPTALINLATLLVTANQVDLISDIARELQVHMVGTAGPLKAQVTSAVALSTARQDELRSWLETEHGSELDLQFLVDASLIGGLLIRVGDNLTDLSVSNQLQSLQDDVLTSV